MTLKETIKAVQGAVGVEQDGIAGKNTWDAVWGHISKAQIASPAKGGFFFPGQTPAHSGKASTFADLADVARYRAAKAAGLSELDALAKGDNGIGCWGDDTIDITRPYVAVTPDDMIARWGSIAGAKHQLVAVTINGKTEHCRVGDRMKWKSNITNGTVLDLAPGAQAVFGIKPGSLVDCEWSWV